MVSKGEKMKFGKNANKKPAFMKCDNCGEETTGEDQNPVRELWVCNDCVEECQERVVLGL
ncbi:MAG: hypothetical protein Tp156SUR915002_24 [Prokaryotic dsDNA virus sp.]|jgi:formylmethanofuran dehydrogenase subunit E|nr:MAG: hypothetical protein Tp162SUR384061_33 [Prokaryotic dsDNA virus sp.]QDP59763.1 MAG: hypothetical protein Tp156SUR915002_24 [Prokaryotic dsDNA virus sp.]|tara:strand:- start:18754 stop:18933 length:180 start_codon:yes stop_codon:yes gene_type:complete